MTFGIVAATSLLLAFGVLAMVPGDLSGPGGLVGQYLLAAGFCVVCLVSSRRRVLSVVACLLALTCLILANREHDASMSWAHRRGMIDSMNSQTPATSLTDGKKKR